MRAGEEGEREKERGIERERATPLLNCSRAGLVKLATGLGLGVGVGHAMKMDVMQREYR